MAEAAAGKLIADYGLLGISILALYAIIRWVLKQNEARENRYLQTISEQNAIVKALSEQLPEMREALIAIKTKVGA